MECKFFRSDSGQSEGLCERLIAPEKKMKKWKIGEMRNMRKYGHDETWKKVLYEKGTCMGIFSDFAQKTRSSFSIGATG